MASPLAATRRTDRGQVTVLMVGLALVMILVIAAVTDLSAGYLRHQTARSCADGAALAAADGAAAPAGYADRGTYVALDPVAAEAAVATYFRRTRATDKYPGLHWSVSVNQERVTVEVTIPYDFPIRMPAFGSGSVVRASGTAVVPIY